MVAAALLTLCAGGCPSKGGVDSASGSAATNSVEGSATDAGEDTTAGTSTGSSTTAQSSAEEGSTVSSSTTDGTMPQVEDCFAARDEAACQAIDGVDFSCAWYSPVYPFTYDGRTCTLAEPTGWCAAHVLIDTGCADNETLFACQDGSTIEALVVRDAEDGTGLVTTAVAPNCGTLLGPGWAVCGDEFDGSPPPCACGCDPGLP